MTAVGSQERPEPTPTTRSGGRRGGSAYRPEIDGLRALAVVAVVAYHAKVPGFSGGYVGVDVFFVISGFLITGLLAREVERTGRLSVPGFYGRRARRLLPVAALVSVTTVAVGWWVLSPLRRHDLAADALATSTYTINLRLAAQQLDYLRANLAPSAFQQFWSLAVEEQFYLLWPLLMLLAMRGRSPRRRATGVVAVVCAASFALAVTRVTPAPAFTFFSLSTRAWQLGLGALLALTWARVQAVDAPRLRRAAIVVGLVLIGATVWSAGESTPWPGPWALVPTLATVSVLAGFSGDTGPVATTLAARPLRWIGVRSYSWYLWHWPAMVLLAAALERSIGGWPAVAAAAATLALADLTYRRLEQPIRSAPRLVASPRLSLGLGLTVTATLAAVFAVLTLTHTTVTGHGGPAQDVARQRLNARQLDQAALVREVPSNLTPALDQVSQDVPAAYTDGCHLGYGQTAPVVCRYGERAARHVVVLFGDSHAAQWQPALDALGQQDHFTLISLTKSACPAAELTVHDDTLRREYTECDQWRDNAIDLIGQLEPDLVIATNISRYVEEGASDFPDPATWQHAYEATLARLTPIAPTVILGDTPLPIPPVDDCIAQHLSDATACTQARVDAFKADHAHAEAAAAAAGSAGYVPTVDLLCGRRRCPVIVGNLLVYRDGSHMTTDYARHLAPQLQPLLAPYLPSAAS